MTTSDSLLDIGDGQPHTHKITGDVQHQTIQLDSLVNNKKKIEYKINNNKKVQFRIPKKLYYSLNLSLS